jgi:hypothetical protein
LTIIDSMDGFVVSDSEEEPSDGSVEDGKLKIEI